MNILGVIPARYASTRFPGKPLAPIAGKPLVQHVVERCREAKFLRDVVVATDDARIASVAEKFARVVMTSPDHPSGTDRVAEVVKQLPCDAAINVQGDEPLISPAVIDAVAKALSNAPISTAASALTDPAEFESPNVVKVVVNLADRALYFSRRTIPYLREAANRPAGEQLAAFAFLKHIGIYGYRADALLKLVALPVSPLEKAEQLEQLRALDNGIEIAVVRVEYEGAAVDVPEDVRRVEERLAALGRTLGKPK